MKKIIAMLLCVCMVFALTACGDDPAATTGNNAATDTTVAPADSTAPATDATTTTGEPEKTYPRADVPETAVEMAVYMKAGWNLGNTLDAKGGETAWGAPITQPELFVGLKEAGFTTVRIPVSWSGHTMIDEDGNIVIFEAWMDRVTDIVQAALDAGLIVIINSHHDNNEYYPTADNLEHATKYMTDIWTQIADNFQDFDERLIFESMNEPRLEGTSKEWWFNTNDAEGKAAIECINSLNQTFVDVVRSREGYNKTRFLSVPSHAANGDYAINGGTFVMPKDTIENHLLLSVHAYSPYDFCMHFNGGTDVWDSSKWMGGINSYLKNLKTRFIDQGVGVYIGETGATNKDNLEDRIAWAKDFTAACKEYGMSAIIWDNMGVKKGDENFGLIDRSTNAPYVGLEDLCKAFVEGLN